MSPAKRPQAERPHTLERPSRPTSERAERTRERMRQAAGHCFAENGFARATVDDIARRAQVSKATVYVHFAGKEELLREVLEETLRDWRETIWGRVERETPDTRDAIAVLMRSSIAYARSHPVLRTILVLDDRLLVDKDLLRRSMDGWRGRLVALVERGIAAGELRADLDPGHAADTIRLWHLSFLDRIYTETMIEVGDPALLEESIGVLVRGLSAT
ncbi:MAG TPA: TetR/AcrR family transcriptional regulator [Thermoanaerobaculia bacterium]|nr:TetR/AcrR family transcriptional regulator [Thermoanaerobaculia bacterium]